MYKNSIQTDFYMKAIMKARKVYISLHFIKLFSPSLRVFNQSCNNKYNNTI